MNKIIFIVLAIIIIGGVFFFFTKSTNAPTTDTDIVQETDEVNVPTMSFFITSENPGTGANFGGLTGADAYCQTLATEAGVGDKTWHAYLSASATESEEAVNARDRIGTGPWYNYNGELIATSVADLHENSRINKETGLTENGDIVNGRGDTPNRHDILTGSNMDGTLAVAENGGDTTCSNWTTESADGSAVVGHHDRIGLDESAPMKSWVSSHGSRGCSLENLTTTGGDGRLYCFAL